MQSNPTPPWPGHHGIPIARNDNAVPLRDDDEDEDEAAYDDDEDELGAIIEARIAPRFHPDGRIPFSPTLPSIPSLSFPT